MSFRAKTSTTRLPQSLIEEIRDSQQYEISQQHRGPQRNRKQARKQERAQQKQRKAEFFSNKRQAETEHQDSPQRKRLKPQPAEPRLLPTKVTPKPPPSRPAKVKTKATKKPLPKQRDNEDEYIAYLEGQLGYKSGKTSRNDDGLDDLLDFTSSLNFAAESLDSASKESERQDGSDDDSTSEESADYSDWGGIQQDEGEDEDEDNRQPVLALKPSGAYIPPHLRRTQPGEDSQVILKLTRQLKGLLNRMSEQNISNILDSVEGLYREHRRNDLTSCLSRLIIDSIASHSSLLDSYVVLYAAFVSALHKIIGIEFAGTFVQNVVASYEQHYNDLGQEKDASVDPEQESEPKGKECSNLIVLLSELYNFQVISCALVYDIIRSLLDTTLTEIRVELLLKIVRNSGQQLRQDDPLALKDIVQIVHDKTANETTMSSRSRFMVETLGNLKNNKLKRNATQNQGQDAVDRMKKFLSSLGKKRHLMAHEPLRVSLDDLHKADTKGKWWLVGAAWGGDPLVEHQETMNRERAQNPAPAETNVLTQLARKQGMNTEIRRNIFIVLMSSEDYVDACERLLQLGLSEVQQRDIVRVLLHCCGNEKAFNPYYVLVCQHLCRNSHSYKITLQFCLWDFLRDLGEEHVGGVEVIKHLKEGGSNDFDVKTISLSRLRNTARAFGWWIGKGCINLSILKPVDFAILKLQTRSFLRHLFVNVFLSSQLSVPPPQIDKSTIPATRDRVALEEVFQYALRNQALAIGVGYFLDGPLMEGDELGTEIRSFVEWASGVAKETLRSVTG